MVITRYDETEVDARAVNLTNQVDTVDIIVPVGFSYPAGSFRISEAPPVTFTHFKADVPSAGGERVFKINGWTAINGEVVEYHYELDYLKDYFYKYGDGTLGSLPMSNTLVQSEYISNSALEYHLISPVNTMVSSVASGTTEDVGVALDVIRPYIVMMSSTGGDDTLGRSRAALLNGAGGLLSNKAVYTFDDIIRLDAFFSKVLKGDPNYDGNKTFTSFYSNITNAFYAPINISDTDIKKDLPNNTIPYLANDGDAAEMIFPNSEDPDWKYLRLPTTGYIESVYDTGIDLTVSSANDLPPYKRYKIFCPYIGFYELPVGNLFYDAMYAETYNLYTKYYYDLINGQVACKFGLGKSSSTIIWSGIRTPFVALPRLTIPTSNYAVTQEQEDNRFSASMIATGIGSLGTIAIGAIFGNPLLIASGVAGGITGLINNGVQSQQNNANNELGGLTTGMDSTMGIMDRQFRLYITTYKTTLTIEQGAKLYGYPVNRYTDTIQYDNLSDSKLWLNTAGSNIRGPEWYVERVRQEYGKDYTMFKVIL